MVSNSRGGGGIIIKLQRRRWYQTPEEGVVLLSNSRGGGGIIIKLKRRGWYQKPGEILSMLCFFMHTHVCSEYCSSVSYISTAGNSSAYATYCIACLVHIVYSVYIYICLSLQAVVRVWHLDWKVQGCFLRPHTRWAQVCRQVHRHTNLPCLQVPSLGMHYDAELFISHPFGSSLVERIELSFVLMLQSCFIKLDEGKGGDKTWTVQEVAPFLCRRSLYFDRGRKTTSGMGQDRYIL